MVSRRSIGDIGEDIAARYIESKGYTIIERNYQIKGGEIDIIAREDMTLVFFEVRYRKDETYGHPLDTLSHKKRFSLKRTAMIYCREKKIDPEMIRIDCIGIMPNIEGGHRVWHVRGIHVS